MILEFSFIFKSPMIRIRTRSASHSFDCVRGGPLLYSGIMVAPKRKSITNDPETDRSSKKRKSASFAENGDRTVAHSILKEEEPSFPRGGASVLTPLEYKQIQIRAKKDVLFEQKTGKKHVQLDSDDEENEDELDGMDVDKDEVPRKAKSKAKYKKESKKLEGPALRIEGLSYKVCYYKMCFCSRLI